MRRQVAERMSGFDGRQLYRDQQHTLTRVAPRRSFTDTQRVEIVKQLLQMARHQEIGKIHCNAWVLAIENQDGEPEWISWEKAEALVSNQKKDQVLAAPVREGVRRGSAR